ncbi:MAG: PAS domain S-box protein, partial [Planctomycetes bacterium]|nr:PAS domain S-box protein [Planctomycetota bacterium]
TGSEFPAEFRILDKNGNKHWVEDRGKVQHDETGKITWMTGFLRDISDRKKTEEELTKSEERFRTIFENVNDIIIYLDNTGTIINTNRSNGDIFGYKSEKIIGKNFSQLGIITSKHLPTMTEQFTDIMKGKRQQGLTHLEITHKNGELVFVEASVSPLTQGAQVEGLLVLARDITERKRTEEALRKQEREYLSLVELSQDGIIVVRGDEIVFANQKTSEISGFAISDFIGKSIFDLIPPNISDLMTESEKQDLIASMTQAVDDNRESRTYTIPVINKSGDLLWIEINANPVEYRGETGRLAFIRDITDRKRWEESLRESEDRFRAIFEHANDEIIHLDKFGTVLDRNIKGEDIIGFTLEEVLGKNISELSSTMPGTQMLDMVRMLENAMEGTGGQGLTELEMKHKNGNTVYVEASVSLLKKDTEIAGLLIIIRDITERKRAEAQILQRNRELAALSAVAQTVSQSIDLDEILNSALDKTLDILNIKHGSV